MTATVLLVEDDPAVVRFFELAFDDLGIELRSCTSVAAALDALEEQAVDLIITDLMLPGEPGSSLLRRLRHGPEAALLRGARLVVCSAGISAAMKAELDGLGVWRQLHKPVAVETLRACVLEGVETGAQANTRIAPAIAQSAAVVSLAKPPACDEDAAVARYFAGDITLFRMYRQACVRQFPMDIASGDAALQAQDMAGFRRLAHSLKSVLLSLGLVDASASAHRLELAAFKADAEGIAQDWPGLRAVLLSLCQG